MSVDWTQVIIALIVGLPGIIAAVGTVINTIRLNTVAANVQKVELATNSMKDALVLATADASHARGLAEGKEYKRQNP